MDRITVNESVMVTLHNKDENGQEYESPIRVNTAVIACYYDFTEADGSRSTCVVLTVGRKLIVRESAEEIDLLIYTLRLTR